MDVTERSPRVAGKLSAKASGAPSRSATTTAPARKRTAARPPAGDPTGKVMARLRGSLGKDYRLDT